MDHSPLYAVLLFALIIAVSGELPCDHPLQAEAQFAFLFDHCNHQTQPSTNSRNSEARVQDDPLVGALVDSLIQELEREKSVQLSEEKSSVGTVQTFSICPLLKIYKSCGTACPPTCQNPIPTFCTLQCVSGCFCRAGLLELDGECLLPSQCNAVLWQSYNEVSKQNARISSRCPQKKIYKSCGTVCPPTCENPSPTFCTLQCVPGCFCQAGLLELNGDCVLPSACNAVQQQSDKASQQIVEISSACPPGMIYRSCGTACPPTCENPFPTICTRQCVAGCFCQPGLVESHGECIPQNQCSAVQQQLDKTSTCPNGKIYNSCGSACPPTCKDPSPKICTLQCVAGCFCPTGYVELNEKCVLPSNCDSCLLPADPGPCLAAIQRYYHNAKTGKCEVFTYGGCGGNSNNYKTMEECISHCGGLHE